MGAAEHQRPTWSRRRLLQLGAGAGAAAAVWRGMPLASGLTTVRSVPSTLGDEALVEHSIDQLLESMARGAASSREITRWYLDRIHRLNPLLGAVIETNPDALSIAEQRDRERRAGRLRGPLHGIPILVKDNLATDDGMETTAGSFALLGSRVPGDATVVARLRQAGAVILGKANLSEWANFRAFGSINGWSGRGGFTRNRYLLSFDPGGSSSGSAVGTAASLCAAAVGTETDGSITYPSSLNSLVGLKPTVGLVSQQGIIPIAFSQDTAGPMARTATDAAILLGVLRSPFPAVGLTPPANLPTDYRRFLRPDALKGARIGIDRFLFDFKAQGIPADFAGQFDLDDFIEGLASAGAVIVEGVSSGRVLDLGGPEFQVLLSEFKVGIRRYLARLSGTPMHDLADLIAFNLEHCDEELVFFGQNIFEMAQATHGLSDPVYLEARRTCLRLSRDNGIDRAFRQHHLDAILGPTFGFASSLPAVAGYPHVSVPGGFDAQGVPVGASLFSLPWQEGKLLGYAFAIETAAGIRHRPHLRGHIPPAPPRLACPAGSAADAAPEEVQVGLALDSAMSRRLRV